MFGDEEGGAQARSQGGAVNAKYTIGERNRQAQKRFRDRQRAKKEEEEIIFAEMADEKELLTGQNEALAKQNLMMAKIIAVREAMLAAFSQTSGRDAGGSWPAEEQTQQLRAAGNHLARAIDDLPTPQELDAAHVAAADFALPSEVHEDVFPAQAPTSLLPAHSLSGAAASLDGSALRALPTVPPASDAMVASTIQAMTSPGQLYAYWQDWTAELKEQWEAAEGARFGAASQAGLARVMDKMTQIWWHAAHLKPAYLADLSFAALPRDGAQQELWAAIAARVLPEMRDADVALMRRAWHAYSKRLAKAAVVAQRWVDRLKRVEVPQEAGAMQSATAASLEMAEICAHMAESAQQEYDASMEFIATQAPATTMLQKAFMNYAAGKFMPDVISIDYHILKLAQLRSGIAHTSMVVSKEPPALESSAPPAGT